MESWLIWRLEQGCPGAAAGRNALHRVCDWPHSLILSLSIRPHSLNGVAGLSAAAPAGCNEA